MSITVLAGGPRKCPKWPFLAVFSPFWAIFGPFWAIFDHFGGRFWGSISGGPGNHIWPSGKFPGNRLITIIPPNFMFLGHFYPTREPTFLTPKLRFSVSALKAYYFYFDRFWPFWGFGKMAILAIWAIFTDPLIILIYDTRDRICPKNLPKMAILGVFDVFQGSRK